MLVKRAGVRGKCKLVDWLEKDPYIAIDWQNDDIPVYRVKHKGARSKSRFSTGTSSCPSLVFSTY